MEKNRKINSAVNRIVNVEMSNYVLPDVTNQLLQTGQYITNGTDNDYFRFIESRYIGSPTNAAVIDAYTNYIYGEGLESNRDISKIISKTDIRLMIKDLKKHGGFSFQIVYSRDKKSIAKIYHTRIANLAIVKQGDITEDIKAYWYCFNWELKTKFKPYQIPAFGYGDKTTEIGYFRIPTEYPLFPTPDWISSVQYAQTEEELSNFYINHIKNNFSAGKLINVNQGVIGDSDDAIEEAERAIVNKFTGTINAGRTIVSINENKDNATTIEDIQIQDAYSNFQYLSNECRDKILMSHKVTNPILFGVKDGSGFGNNADEMKTALKTVYRNQIKPIREIFIDGLTEVFSVFDPEIEFRFKDFDELVVETNEVQMKQWKSSPDSSNVRKISYNDETRDMVIQFNSGDIYTYPETDIAEFTAIFSGAGICRTEGENRWGSWFVGKTPSVGAAVYNTLVKKNKPYKKGGNLK